MINIFKQKIKVLTCIAAAAMVTITATACGNNGSSSSSETSASKTEISETLAGDKADSIGEGAVSFVFSVVKKDGTEKTYQVHTDSKTVGEALESLNIISGDESDYGLYVKTVDGETLDYDKDKMYWAFYIGDQYAQTGVDSADVKEGESYSFRAEKG